MRSMFRNMWLEYKFGFYEGANHVIYFFQHIPLIGKKIKDKLYSYDDIKMGLGILGFILSLVKRFFKIFIPLAIYLVGILIYKGTLKHDLSFAQGKEIFIYYFWILSMIAGSYLTVKIFSFTDKDYLLFKVMNFDVKSHYIREILTRFLSQTIAYFVVFSILFSCKKAILLVFAIAGYRLFSEAFAIFKSKHEIFKNKHINSIIVILILLAALAMIAFPYKYSISIFERFIFNPIHLSAAIIIGILSAAYIILYRDYDRYVKINLTKEIVMEFNDIKVNAEKDSVQIDEKKLTSEELDSKRFENKSGYEYLNEIFFVRNSRIINKPLKRKCIGISLLFIILNIVILFINQKYKDNLWSEYDRLITSLVFFMYMLSSGRNVIKALFFYCDRSLLKYGYYRRGNAVLKNFYLRIKKVILIDFIPAAIICLGLVISTILLGHTADIMKIVPLLLCTLILPIFYSVYYMAIYYLFQPYTSEMEKVSPAFKFASGFIYFLAYVSINYKGDPLIFTLIVLLVTVVTIAASLVLIYKKAPKTFRIK